MCVVIRLKLSERCWRVKVIGKFPPVSEDQLNQAKQKFIRDSAHFIRDHICDPQVELCNCIGGRLQTRTSEGKCCRALIIILRELPEQHNICQRAQTISCIIISRNSANIVSG